MLGLEGGVAVHVLEPFGRVARRVLDFQHFDAAFSLVARERMGQVHLDIKCTRECDRILERKLGPRPDREMSGMRGIAHQHDGHVPIPVDPRLANDALKAKPNRRAAQVRSVALQPVAVQIAGKDALAKVNSLLLRHAIDSRALPHYFRRLDDESRHVAVVLIRVRLEPPPRRVLERERKRREFSRRAEPGEATTSDIDIRFERQRVFLSDPAVAAVARDHDVRGELACCRLIVGDIGFEDELDVKRSATPLQDVEQTLSSDAAKSVATRGDCAALEVHVNVVPPIERANDLGGGCRIGGREVPERLVGKHDAPTKGIGRPIAFDDAHDPLGVGAFDDQRRIQSRGSPADTENAHSRRWETPPAGRSPQIVSISIV